MTGYAVIGLVGLGAAALFVGDRRWKAVTEERQAGLSEARVQITPSRYDPRELDGLPPPVRRYFRTVLAEGQPMVSEVFVEHEGTFNMSETGEQWRPFTSTQRVVTRRPGFLWNARVAVAPGIGVRVHDAYIGGKGILHASLFGLVSVVHMGGTPEVDEGELYRWFAEAAWYPTALLPSQGVRWEAVDDRSARATFTDGETTVSMLFGFDDDGLIAFCRAEARGRTVAGQTVPTPWEGRWRDWQEREGMRVPLEGEVAWILPAGSKPYWRGRIRGLRFTY